jgi:hypothetical protein
MGSICDQSSNIEDLKREWTERQMEIISTGELKIVIGKGLAPKGSSDGVHTGGLRGKL